MRWAEIALFLSPLGLYVAWRLAARYARPGVVWGALAVVVALAVGTVLLGVSRRLEPSQRYVPAHVVDGRLVPGHAAP